MLLVPIIKLLCELHPLKNFIDGPLPNMETFNTVLLILSYFVFFYSLKNNLQCDH